uniref:Uncharacterized protein n=1 Tax=Cannabis sativa TaxID=3483 RepID=A0A803PUS0_CANSA
MEDAPLPPSMHAPSSNVREGDISEAHEEGMTQIDVASKSKAKTMTLRGGGGWLHQRRAFLRTTVVQIDHMMLATPGISNGSGFLFRSHAINEDELIGGDYFSLPLVSSCGLSSDLLPKRRTSSITDEPNGGHRCLGFYGI